MVDETVADGCLVNVAWLRVADLKVLVRAVLVLPSSKFAMKR